MIISRTPFRISFFGGGTDYHTWYEEHGGAVLSTSINHYCYITCRNLPPFFENKSRVVWSRIEHVNDHSEIQHPAVRAVLKYLDIEHGVEIHHTGDLPARAGLGSSSSFTVGMLNAAHAMLGRMSSKRELACEAVHIERDVLRENVGVQDQIAAAYGGFNRIDIQPDGDFSVSPVILPAQRLRALQDSFLLFFTGVSRTASDIAQEQMKLMGKKTDEMRQMHLMVSEAVSVLNGAGDLDDFGRLLHDAWMIKRSLAKNISPDYIDEIYARARAAGALGGKLLGAGGGGFMLFFAPPEHHPRILEALKELLYVPFGVDGGGSNIIFFEPNVYSGSSLTRRDYRHLQAQEEPQKAHAGKRSLVRGVAL